MKHWTPSLAAAAFFLMKLDPKQALILETIDTDDLVEELRRRHSVFFLVGRPMSMDGEQYDRRVHWGCQEVKPNDPRAIDTVVGLATRGINTLINPKA